jgi:serine/threonine-protein kinase
MQLFSRAINQFEAVPLEGTENAFGPFFSPDGQWIGFFADGKLKKTTVTGGKPVSICEAVDGLSGSWGLDDVIVFQSRYGSGLQSVRPAGDSPPKSLTVLDSGKGEVAHLWPQILPGGKAILLTICTGDIGSYDDARIAVQVIGEAKPRSLDLHGASARYVPTGHLIYAQNGRLLAVPFDLSHLTITGIPQAVIEGVLTMFAGAAEFALSETGTLAYIPGGAYQPDRAVVLADRRGVFRPFSKEHAYYLEPAVSKSGSVIVRIQAANDDLWLFDSHRGRPVRLTTLDGDEVNPVWTPDGKRIVFSWGRTGARNLYWMNTDGSGKPELLNESNNNQIPGSVSPDGNVLAFWEENPRNRRDIYLLPLKGERKPQPFMVTSFDEWAPKFSPDGRFIAFASDKSGRDEVYVKAVQGPTGERQISSEGGMWPAWSHKGRELFFVSDNKLMCAGIDPESGTPGSTEFLFEVPKLIQNRIVPVYDVMPDDKSFVMVVRDIPPPPRELRVVLNWFEELKRLAPTGKK